METSGQLHGGQLVVKSLKRAGVRYLFSLTGSGIDHIYDACLDEGINVITTRHEQAAACMADAWARVTGEPGVVAATKGPGMFAMVPGIANSGPSPVLALAGKTNLCRIDMRESQEFDQVGVMKPITKWAHTVYQTERIPEYVNMALREATTGSPGPVFLDIPQDVLQNKIDEKTVSFPDSYTPVRPQGDPAAIRRAINLILAAKRPVLIGGGGLWWSRAAEELRGFVELVNVPVILKNKGRGAIPEDHPLFVGPALIGVEQADVILIVGRQMDHWLGYGQPPQINRKARIIEVDIDPRVIGQNRAVDVGIVGDARAVLSQLTQEAGDRCGASRKDSPWVKECRRLYLSWRQLLEANAESDAVPIHPARLVKEVAAFLDRDAVVTIDGGIQGNWANRFFKAYYPGHLVNHRPLAALGAAVPFAIAAKLAKPDKQVLACCGDGAFGITGMEFDTAVRYKIPIVAVIANNGCWGTNRHRQLRLFGRTTGTDLGNTRYDLVVKALGGHGEWVEKPEEIRPALQRSFASGLPACVNVRTDPSVGLPNTGESSD